MKEIILSNGKVVLIDDDDFARVSQYNWHDDGRGRAKAHINGRQIKLSRFILSPPRDKDVDHKNGITLDNRKENLIVCSRGENICRRRKFKGPTTSKYKGVYFQSERKKWRAKVTFRGVVYHIGLFDSENDAARAYNTRALELHGEFALINLII